MKNLRTNGEDSDSNGKTRKKHHKKYKDSKKNLTHKRALKILIKRELDRHSSEIFEKIQTACEKGEDYQAW